MSIPGLRLGLDLIFGALPAVLFLLLSGTGLVVGLGLLREGQALWPALEVLALGLGGLFASLCLLFVIARRGRVSARQRAVCLAGLGLGLVLAAVYLVGMLLTVLHTLPGEGWSWAFLAATLSIILVAANHVRMLVLRRNP